MAILVDHKLAQKLEGLEGEASTRFIEARARVKPESGACWIEVGGAYAMFDGPASPITQTFGLGMWNPVTAAVLGELEGFFFSREAPVNHEVSPFAGVEVYRLLADRGYRPIELTSILYREAGDPLPGTVNPRVKVRIAGPEECRLWAEVSARGWVTEHPELMEFVLDFGEVVAAKVDSVNFLAEIDGSAVAAGSLSLGGELAALLAGASTVPEGRRRGAQYALLDARLRYAAAQGCELAMMGAAVGSSSQRNAERNGFRIAYTRVKWTLPERAGVTIETSGIRKGS